MTAGTVNRAGTILLVEDEPDLVKLLERNLAREGFRVQSFGNGLDALEAFRKSPPDLILLDLMLPGMSGLEVCRSIRRDSRVPIVIVTAKSEETDRVVGLELGADDYIAKPFSVRELVARVKAVLRRTHPAPGPGTSLTAGTLEVDRDRHEARLAGVPLVLTLKEFGLLAALLQADGKVLSREDLLNGVWGYTQAAELDTRTVDQHVARLREKLAGEAARLVTVRGAGYRLVRE